MTEKCLAHSTMSAASQVLEKAMELDERIIVMAADLVGSCKISNIEKKFPNRFINVGIAEQNMIGMAAGLAKEGFQVFAYTFSTFASLRAAEQIRTDVFYNKLNVKIVGTHSGLSTGPSGPTHYSLEDMGILRSIPQSRLFVPADAYSTERLLEQLIKDSDPAYIRLDRNPLPDLYEVGAKIVLGEGYRLREGQDGVIVANGCMSGIALDAAELLEKEGLNMMVIDMPSVKPLGTVVLKESLLKGKKIFTLEEHNVTNGLGTAICEYVARNGLGITVQTLGIDECYPRGMQLEENREELKLSVKGVAQQIMEGMRR